MRKEDIFKREYELSALKAPIGTFVKDERIAGDLIAREHFAQNDVVVARLVDRGDPAAELSGGALEQRQIVGAVRDGTIIEPVLMLARDASG